MLATLQTFGVQGRVGHQAFGPKPSYQRKDHGKCL